MVSAKTMPNSDTANSDGFGNPTFNFDENYNPGEEANKPKSDFAMDIVDKEYDPYDHCNSKKPTSYLDSMLHLLKASIGTGILAIPKAFMEVGYGVGVVGVIVMGMFYTLCVHLLVATEYEICRRRRTPNLSYANTVQGAFELGPQQFRFLAKTGKFFGDLFFMIYESGGCAIYIIFIAQNLKEATGMGLSDRQVVLLLCVPVVLICWIRNLKILAPLSAIANVMTIICFGLVFYYVFQGGVPTTKNREMSKGTENIATYFTTVLFAIACTGIIMPLKAEMRHPRQFAAPAGVLNMSMIPICTLYAVFGLFGYLRYGDTLQDTITLNLPHGEMLAKTIQGCYSLTVFVGYFLCYYVVLDIVWKNYIKEKLTAEGTTGNKKVMWEYVVRTAIPVFTFVLALAIPKLGVIIDLVAAFGIATTSLVIPIIVHTLLFWDTYDKSSARFALFAFRNITLLILSMAIFLIGVYNSVAKTIQSFNN